MTRSPSLKDEQRKWYGLALRHLRIARRLLRSGFADGAVFHTYHAYECAVGALIAANGYLVPPHGQIPRKRGTNPIPAYRSPAGLIRNQSAHKARLLLFESVADRAKPYYKTQARLARFLTVPVRNDSLYYNSRTGTLPQDVYNNVWAQQALNVVRHFVLEVGQEVK